MAVDATAQDVLIGRADWCVECGDCLSILPTLPAESFDAVVTDPPYLNDEDGLTLSHSVLGEVRNPTPTVANPWGFDLGWVDVAARAGVKQWVVFANYRTLAPTIAALERHAKLSCIFTWRKSNAPNMARPVPRMDCEFIVWARAAGAPCGRMGEFRSTVVDHPFPSAGCCGTGERLLRPGGKQAAHPCQKPLGVVRPFVQRLAAEVVLDPFAGTGTTGVACLQVGRRFVGIEKESGYVDLARLRLADYAPLFAAAPPAPPPAPGLFDALAPEAP